jgi:hypothetical protein
MRGIRAYLFKNCNKRKKESDYQGVPRQVPRELYLMWAALGYPIIHVTNKQEYQRMR